jgi:hypothetical protein
MSVEGLIGVLIWALAIFILAWVAYYVITKFFPGEIQLPILAVVGVIFLLIIFYAILGGVPRVEFRR